MAIDGLIDSEQCNNYYRQSRGMSACFSAVDVRIGTRHAKHANCPFPSRVRGSKPHVNLPITTANRKQGSNFVLDYSGWTNLPAHKGNIDRDRIPWPIARNALKIRKCSCSAERWWVVLEIGINPIRICEHGEQGQRSNSLRLGIS